MNSHRFSAGILVAALAAGLAMGSGAEDRADSGPADFEQAMTAAQAAREKAAAAGGEWRDIGKFLKQAAEAAAKGDFATATRLAAKAGKQGELGYDQAVSQKDAGLPAYMIAASGRDQGPGSSTPEEDQAIWQGYYQRRFPKVPTEDFADGVYAIDPVGRENWEAIEEFPPYEMAISAGEKMWKTPFANGKTYQDCFPAGPAAGADYPHWDQERGMVITLPLAINECRKANGEEPFKYKKGPIADVLSYIRYQSRGQPTQVEIPQDDPKAREAYEKGKQFYFARRGQLNFACAHCHVQNPGNLLRSDLLSPAFGHTTHFPVYRSKWGEMGTLHRRFAGCNKQVRAKPFKAQGEEYRNLEYFLTYMQNGLPLNGPGARK